MTDAQVIPIGSGGRPGRGTGRRTTPSAAARSLAGPSRRKPTPDDPAAPDPGAASPENPAEAATSGTAKRAKPKTQRSKAKASTTSKASAAKRASARKAAEAAEAVEAAADGGGKTAGKKTVGKSRASRDRESTAASGDSTVRAIVGDAVDRLGADAAGDRLGDNTAGQLADAADGRLADVNAARPGDAAAGRRSDDAARAGAGSHLRDVTSEATRAAGAGGTAGTGGADEEAPGAGRVPGDAGQFEAFERMVRDTLGAGAERKVAELLAFLRRRLTGDYEVDEFGYDPELTDAILMPLVRPMAEKWFRVEVRGVENIPADGGALIVANHSGTLPIDGIVTQLVVKDNTGRALRTLGADLVFKTPFVGELVRKGGGTLAGNDDAERLLGRGDLVGVWPEGFKGIGKPFSERYKLQRFGRGGFVSAAMRTGVPIVPCSIVGAEEIYPLIGNVRSLARLLGVPYIPITPFFPLLGLLGLIPLPSKWLIEFGEPIRTDEFADGAADDPMLVFNVTDQVRETIQQTLYSLLMQRRSVFF